MEVVVAMGLGGWALLIVGAVVIGVVTQLAGRARFSYEWVATAIGAAIGGLVASEFVVGWRTFEPVTDGLALVPAALGGIVLGAVVAVVARFGFGDAYSDRPMSA
jgi:hypothetical protein